MFFDNNLRFHDDFRWSNFCNFNLLFLNNRLRCCWFCSTTNTEHFGLLSSKFCCLFPRKTYEAFVWNGCGWERQIIAFNCRKVRMSETKHIDVFKSSLGRDIYREWDWLNGYRRSNPFFSCNKMLHPWPQVTCCEIEELK